MGNITPDPDDIWRGIGGNFHSLTEVLCEFIDNSLSVYRTSKLKFSEIWIDIEELSDDELLVMVADTAGGIDDLDVAMKLGEKSGGVSQLNEHGFGMKHALATANPTNDSWEISTMTSTDKSRGEFRKLIAPYGWSINPISSPITDWFDQSAIPGTVVKFVVTREMFNTVQLGVRGKANFARCLDYLRDDLGCIYSHDISAGRAIKINDVLVPAVVPHIAGHYGPNKATSLPEVYNQDLGKGMVEISLHFQEIADHPTSIRHYKKSTSCSGLEIRIEGRLIESNIFTEVWGKDIHNSYNHFHVQANLKSAIPGALPQTKSTKNGLRMGTEIIETLYSFIQNIFPTPPKKPSDKSTEKDLVNELEGLYQATVKGVVTEQSFATWTTHEKDQKNQPKLDLYVFDPAKGKMIEIFEAKTMWAGPKDFYQLLMYWDGMVADGMTPTVGYLIAASHSAGAKSLINFFNTQKDLSGNSYNFEITTWKQRGISYPA